ncbi:gastrin-releasing peptide [Puma concolor]|uniref:Gastrin-releasing peptide n=1 Tax=Puma concolor TaxID=9696 RepID=A0A6P6IIZ8_PUMCO|nr:gastrin-releasing peptide [Puma concolor]
MVQVQDGTHPGSRTSMWNGAASQPRTPAPGYNEKEKQTRLINVALRGHLMGKKSTRESPYVYEGGSLKQQLQYILWEEAARNLLSLMEGKGTGSYQPPQRELLAIRQSPWDSQDGSAFKVVGSKRKE